MRLVIASLHSATRVCLEIHRPEPRGPHPARRLASPKTRRAMGPDKDVSREMQLGWQEGRQQSLLPMDYLAIPSSGHPDRGLPKTELWFVPQGFLC